MFDIKKQLTLLPDNPGVYLMKDEYENIIYVGKAVVLKNRVKQYFQKNVNHSMKVKSMVNNIKSFEYIITDNELEALILECNLIKKYRPKYNILLRDDKTYPYIKVTINEDFPRVIKVRKILNDGAKYFGPYTNISAVNATLDILNKVYPIRTCNYDMERAIKLKMRPCLEYYIKNCIGPCTGMVESNLYKKYIENIISFLNGKSDEVVFKLKEKMLNAAKSQRFEEAAEYRDKIKSIEETLVVQKITKVDKKENRDLIAIATNGIVACIEVFFVRNGLLLGRENFILEGVTDETTEDMIANFVKQFYSEQKYIPKEILVEKLNSELDNYKTFLSNIAGHKVEIKVPQKGEKLQMINLVKKNAIEYLEKFVQPKFNKNDIIKYDLEELKRLLELDDIPRRIEAYDISNIQGTDSVGAMVVFSDGKRDRHEYRRYKINSVQGANDVASMAEIIKRRLKYGNYPNLILVDGARNQVNAVKDVLDENGVCIEVWGMYKDDKHRTKGLINDECSFELDRKSSIYKFIASIQEEVHRYAITYHRSIRDKNTIHSKIDEINGIGKIKRKLLLNKFKSIEGIKNASIEDISKIKGINRELAVKIKEYLQGDL